MTQSEISALTDGFLDRLKNDIKNPFPKDSKEYEYYELGLNYGKNINQNNNLNWCESCNLRKYNCIC